jgi:hypothetical protein
VSEEKSDKAGTDRLLMRAYVMARSHAQAETVGGLAIVSQAVSDLVLGGIA